MSSERANCGACWFATWQPPQRLLALTLSQRWVLNAWMSWLAGGGVKTGFRYGKTDDYGFYAVENKVHIHDLHATILHILGMDHEKLTYRFAGRDFRLTDIEGHVVKDLLA